MAKKNGETLISISKFFNVVYFPDFFDYRGVDFGLK